MLLGVWGALTGNRMYRGAVMRFKLSSHNLGYVVLAGVSIL